jgi:hypothetical protein
MREGAACECCFVVLAGTLAGGLAADVVVPLHGRAFQA